MRAIASETATNIFKEQFIPDHVFIYGAKGALRIFDGSQDYVFKLGDAFLARKNRLAKYELLESDEDFEPILFCFDEPFLKEFRQKHGTQKVGAKTSDAIIRIRKSAMVTSFVKSIKPYYKGVMQLDSDFEDVKYEELLLVLLKHHPELSAILFDFAQPEKINLEAFMNKNFAFNVSLKDFAASTGRSLSAFKRDFAGIFNQTPSRWLVSKRLEEAYFLLSEKQRRPNEIYLDLGFSSLSHFSTAFKNRYGRSPSELCTVI